MALHLNLKIADAAGEGPGWDEVIAGGTHFVLDKAVTAVVGFVL